MMIMMRTLVCTYAIATFLALVPTGADELESKELGCLTDWSKAGPIVRERSLTPPEDVLMLAEGEVPGRLLKMSLCDDKGRYIYRLVIYAQSGELKRLNVDARRPFFE